MKIAFLLPGSGHTPVGGFRVVYEYANGLAHRGHEVTVIHAPYRRYGERSFRQIWRSRVIYVARRFNLAGGFRPGRWFRPDPRVRLMWLPSLHEKWQPDADAVIATAWETAEWLETYSERIGRKFYLVQHWEGYFERADEARVAATWKAPLQKIVISKWLQEKAEELGETAQYIPNGLNFVVFGLDAPIEKRDGRQILMLHHTAPWKSTADGIKALTLVREQIGDIRVRLFGVCPRPMDLPEWIAYEQNPAQARLRQLYNEAATFVGPSLAEGWPLPPAEAAQCGAALSLTDIGGHREYGIHEQTALLSPPGDPPALADNIRRLVQNEEMRIRLARESYQYVQQFTWERAVNSLVGILQGNPA